MSIGFLNSRLTAVITLAAVFSFANCKKAEPELKEHCAKLSDGEIFEEVTDGVSVISKFEKGIYVFDVENKTKRKSEAKINWVSPCTVSLQWPSGTVEEMKFVSFKDGVFQYDQTSKADIFPITKKEGENPEGKCDFFKSGQMDLDRKSINAGPAIMDVNGEIMTLKDVALNQVFGTWSIKWDASECSFRGKIVQHTDPKAVGLNTLFTIADIKGKMGSLKWSGISSGQIKLVGQK